MSSKEEKVISDPSDMSFKMEDCIIQTPVNPRTGRGFRWPASNGEFTLEGKPGQESEGAQQARRVVVTHTPTGLVVAEDRFMASRNKELALRELEKKVNNWIERQQKSDKPDD
tara:strand:+ start:249 stop:587 length:339 start_codon:yes stop_codon:yes gene_type:complete